MTARVPKMWVHRLSAFVAGSPQADVTLEQVENDLGDVARAVMLGPCYDLPDDSQGANAFLQVELFERGVLRQGWGAPGMRADRESQFLKQFVIAMWRYWKSIDEKARDDLRREGNYARVFQILEPYYRQARGASTSSRA